MTNAPRVIVRGSLLGSLPASLAAKVPQCTHCPQLYTRPLDEDRDIKRQEYLAFLRFGDRQLSALSLVV